MKASDVYAFGMVLFFLLCEIESWDKWPFLGNKSLITWLSILYRFEDALEMNYEGLRREVLNNMYFTQYLPSEIRKPEEYKKLLDILEQRSSLTTSDFLRRSLTVECGVPRKVIDKCREVFKSGSTGSAECIAERFIWGWAWNERETIHERGSLST